jgi:uncharacterized protein YcfJ
VRSRGAILGGVPLFQLLDDAGRDGLARVVGAFAGRWIALSITLRTYGSDAVVPDG